MVAALYFHLHSRNGEGGEFKLPHQMNEKAGPLPMLLCKGNVTEEDGSIGLLCAFLWENDIAYLTK